MNSPQKNTESAKREAPERLVRAMGAEVEVDVASRTLKRALFVTRAIASDGMIVVPDGINVRFFQENPVVLAIHGRTDKFPVCGRSLGMKGTREGMESVTQFADTELGRELAYLYGVNEKREVYARGWSFAWSTKKYETWTVEHAKQWLGADWDPALVPEWVVRNDMVDVVLECVMNEYSAVPLGADKKALSRAYGEAGNRTAAAWLADLDLTEALDLIRRLERQGETNKRKLEQLEQDIQALRRDGASAATRGDSDAILRELDGMIAQVRMTIR